MLFPQPLGPINATNSPSATSSEVSARAAARPAAALYALALGTLEWLRTAWVFASLRAEFGQPYARLLAILGGVALVTALAWVLRTNTGRAHFLGPR